MSEHKNPKGLKLPVGVDSGRVNRTEYFPVHESGALSAPRLLDEAEQALELYPAGGTFSDGQPYDGYVGIVCRDVVVSYGPLKAVGKDAGIEL